jgi:hypothetical protein
LPPAFLKGGGDVEERLMDDSGGERH